MQNINVKQFTKDSQTLGLCGFFFIKSGLRFSEWVQKTRNEIQNKSRELIIDDVFASLDTRNIRINYIKVNDYIHLGTPEEYLEYKEKEKARDQQSIGYMIMFGSAMSAAAIFVIGLITLLFLAAMSFGSSSNDTFEDVFFFFWNLLKICFWAYVGSHVIIARPWQYFGERDEEKPVEEKRLVQCPACDATMRIPGAYEGRAKCPACGEEFKV